MSVKLALGSAFLVRRNAQRLGAGLRRTRIGHPQRDFRDCRAMGDVGAMGKTEPLGVDQQIDLALLPARHLLGDMGCGLAEAQGGQECCDFWGGFGRGDNFDELDPFDSRRRGEGGQIDGQGRFRPAYPVHKVD